MATRTNGGDRQRKSWWWSNQTEATIQPETKRGVWATLLDAAGLIQEALRDITCRRWSNQVKSNVWLTILDVPVSLLLVVL